MWYQSFSSGDLLKHGPIPFLHTIVSSWTPLSYMPISEADAELEDGILHSYSYFFAWNSFPDFILQLLGIVFSNFQRFLPCG
jgi:hypothetical protein